MAIFLFLLTLIGAGGFTPAAAQDLAPDNPWVKPAEAFKILGPIHYVGTEDLAVYLIATPEGHIVIDGGVKGSIPAIEGSIRALGFKPEDIKILLTTQAHYDHVASMAYFQRLSKARVEVMAGDAKLLESGGEADYLAAEWGAKARFERVKATRILKDGDKVTLGGVTLTARHTPGHTPGCTTFIMDVPAGGRAYNVVFPGSMTINSGTRLVGKESYPGIARDYARSLDFLESLKPDIILMAHASAFDLPAKRDRLKKDPSSNPFGDVAGYRAWIAANRANLQKQIKEQEASR
nr:SubclassB3_beta_lactamase [uncultured bacterium]